MPRSLKLLLLLVIWSTSANAQTFHQVTATTGSQNIGGKTVTVTKSGLSYAGNTGMCFGTMGYRIMPGGSTSNSGLFNYSFNTPVYHIKMHFLGFDGDNTGGDTVFFYD